MSDKISNYCKDFPQIKKDLIFKLDNKNKIFY